jgi:hypothetical protein
MSIEIQWNEPHPETGEKWYIEARHFARVWTFYVRYKRRSEWELYRNPSLAMWENVLSTLRRKYTRRDSVEIEDIKHLEKHIKSIRPALLAWEEKKRAKKEAQQQVDETPRDESDSKVPEIATNKFMNSASQG